MHDKTKTLKKGSIWKKVLIGLAIVMMVLVMALAFFQSLSIGRIFQDDKKVLRP